MFGICYLKWKTNQRNGLKWEMINEWDDDDDESSRMQSIHTDTLTIYVYKFTHIQDSQQTNKQTSISGDIQMAFIFLFKCSVVIISYKW